ncbi:hypothetical protein [Photobacterium sp. OFAV2-7]|uniref:hypothetical protein n=1 Tax=Photobacterium sp. OFAV2-7 TaxID=2917748 RepID=UPI001EF5A8E0|nr:hypothetical protein [Photobacterium sp. OFAV2-7]MCG7587362.1 hypothetical protein [Photobacterium sp. OFAV2-7]
MSSHDRIEDIEQLIYMAYQEGNYQEAKALEAKIKKLKGNSQLYDDNEPYSIEGKVFIDE